MQKDILVIDTFLMIKYIDIADRQFDILVLSIKNQINSNL